MKTLKLIFKTLLLSSIFVCLFPLAVFADMNAYGVISGSYTDILMPSGKYRTIAVNKSNFEGRAVLFHNVNQNNYTWAIVWTSSFKFRITVEYATPERPTSYNRTASSYTYNDVTYYYYSETVDSIENNYGYIFSTICPAVIDYSGTNTVWHDVDTIIDYTYGGAVVPEPEPPIDWGSIRDPEYSTRIAGSGSAAKQNVDVLRWNNEIDTNGNDISECEIEIQAVPGSWSDSTLQGLLNKTLNDLDFTGVQPVSLDTVAASDGLYNVSWQSVVNSLNWVFDEYLYARQAQENLWKKYGWYYRIRLLSPDGYEGQWQTLYTPLTSSAQDSETVINHNSFDMSVNQVYQNITQLNNNTSVTIVYNDTDYTVQNPTNGNEPSGGTSLWDVLKELLNGIFQILAKLGDLVVGLIDNLFDLFRSLFTPPEVDQTVNNDINLNINNYITESQPGLQDQQLHLHQIFSDLDSISSAYSSGGSCVLQWDDVSMDLSVFNAGTVTFIPGGTYDFKAAFMQLLAGFGMTYATYQMLVSGVIYILLFVLISHKVKGFLKKT